MIKNLIKFFLFLIIIFTLIIFYLSFIGIETTKFNKKINNEILDINEKFNLELKSVKFLLKPSNLSINVKTFGPELVFNNHQLKLEYIKTNISLKSFINDEFSIDDLQISTKSIKLKDIILLLRSFGNSPELFILDNIIKEGILVADINLNFDDNGKIKDDYLINGFIKNGKLSLLNKESLDNLNLFFNIKNQEYFLEDISATFGTIKLSSQYIKIKKKENLFFVNSKVITNDKNANIILIKKLLGENFKKLKIEKVNLDTNNDFTFNINKKFKIKDLNVKSIINLNNLEYKNELSNIRKYLPNFKEVLKLKDHKIVVNYNKKKLEINGSGKLIIENKTDKLDYKVTKKDNKYNFKTDININENPLLIDILNYKKKINLNSLLELEGIYENSKGIKFNSVLLNENKNKFLIKNLELDNKLKILNIDLLEVDYINNNKIQNQIILKKDKNNYEIRGINFDASKFIEDLLNNNNNNDESSLFINLNSLIDINISKTYLDKNEYVENLSANIKFIDNKINKLKLDSKFPNGKKLTITINTNDNNERIMTLFSSYPKPLLKNFKFIKGFEEGVLDFYSIKKNNISNSVLIIDNFKVQEVPVLAKLLTLASLQGIADLLTGEGIRFTDLEMRFSNKKGVMTIEEMYAIGPAISILLDGYIDSKKLISLRGTLVPATTINRTISSIPLIGNILVGKKTGEGVFGVSFKIKGTSKNLKTTVNPIKTLTPRFITRTLDKIKKN